MQVKHVKIISWVRKSISGNHFPITENDFSISENHFPITGNHFPILEIISRGRNHFPEGRKSLKAIEKIYVKVEFIRV